MPCYTRTTYIHTHSHPNHFHIHISCTLRRPPTPSHRLPPMRSTHSNTHHYIHHLHTNDCPFTDLYCQWDRSRVDLSLSLCLSLSLSLSRQGVCESDEQSSASLSLCRVSRGRICEGSTQNTALIRKGLRTRITSLPVHARA